MHGAERSSFFILAGLFVPILACSGGGSNPLGNGGGGSGSGSTTDSSTSTTSTGAGGTGSSTGTGSGGAAPLFCPGKPTVEVQGSAFCAEGAMPACDLVTAARNNLICDVPLTPPTGGLVRSSGVKEYAGSGPPQLGCFSPANYPSKANPGASKKVTLSGVVKIFSHGCESKQVQIDVFEAASGDLGASAGSVTTPASCMAGGVATQNADCGTRYECKYSIPNVPTEKELVVKLSGPLWTEMYTYGVFIPNGGPSQRDLVVMASDDFNVIVQAATGGPPTPGNGAVFGEVHDCGDVRLMSAVAAISQPDKLLAYFTPNEDHPLPDLAAKGTAATGLYAAFDVPSGPVSAAAEGNVGGSMKTLGFQRAKVFPDAVTLITFRGVQPYQVP
jgi:hypothetical protein